MKKILIITALLTATGASAQNKQVTEFFRDHVDAVANYDVRFDNREYKSDFSSSQTFFNHRLDATVRLRFAGYNCIAGGVNAIRHIGRHATWGQLGVPDKQPKPELSLYFWHYGSKLTAVAGVFPRTMMYGMPAEIFSWTRQYYDPMIEGLHLRYESGRTWVEFTGDWYSAYGQTQREKFILYSSAQWEPVTSFGLKLGYYASLQHFSVSEQDEGVVDNAVVKPWIGVDGVRLGGGFRFGASAAWLQSFQRDRLFSDKVLTPGGVWLGADFQWRGFMLRDWAYFGKNLMPLWGSYGADLYLGDPWFRTTHGVYNRIEASWGRRFGKIVNLRLSSIHHFDGARWGWQQMGTLSVSLNRNTLK